MKTHKILTGLTRPYCYFLGKGWEGDQLVNYWEVVTCRDCLLNYQTWLHKQVEVIEKRIKILHLDYK